MITHTVFFKLRHAAESSAEVDFLKRARALATIAEVRAFQCVKQVGKKNPYGWGLTMTFADEAAYQRYNDNPDHQRFVTRYWLSEVEQFVEIDYVAQP